MEIIVAGKRIPLFLGATVPVEVIYLAEKRENYRAQGDFIKADELRAEINSVGFQVRNARSYIRLEVLRT